MGYQEGGRGVYRSPLRGVSVWVFVSVGSVLVPKEVLFHSLTRGRGKDLHTLFALTCSNKASQ